MTLYKSIFLVLFSIGISLAKSIYTPLIDKNDIKKSLFLRGAEYTKNRDPAGDEDSKFKSNGGEIWEKVGEDITPQNAFFSLASCGIALDISEDGKTVIVGCPGYELGSVHLYRLGDGNNGDGTSTKTWNEIMKWVGQNEDVGLGSSVSIDNSSRKVSFYSGRLDDSGNPYGGRVQVFENKNNSDEFVPVGESIDGTVGMSTLSGDGKKICVADYLRYKVHVYHFDGDQSSWKHNIQIDTSNIGGPDRVALSEDGKKVGFVVDGFMFGHPGAELFGIGDLEKSIYSDNESTSIAISGEGSVLAVGYACEYNCGYVRLFDVTMEYAVQIGGDILGGDGCGLSLDLSHDGKTVAIGCFNKALIATLNESNPEKLSWDIEDEIVVNGFGAVIVALSSDSETVALGGYMANIYNGAVGVYKRTTDFPNQIIKLK